MLRRVLFQIHLWTGVAAGLYILVVCTTGAALVFRIEAQRATYPHLFTPSGSGPTIDAVTVMERVQDAFPDGRLSGVDAPTTLRPTYLAYVTRGNTFLTILADPVTGTVLGELDDRSFVRLVQDLHFDLMAGRTGRTVNGIGAAFLLVMCVTGLVIWWQGTNWRRGLTVDFRRSWRRINWDLHSAVGIWTALLVVMWSVTGVYFAFPAGFRRAVNAVSPVTVTRPPQSDPAGRTRGTPPSWRALIDVARARVPGKPTARVVLPSNERGAFLVQFADVAPTPAGSSTLTSVYLDRFTGRVLQAPAPGRRTAGDAVMAWVAPLHVGNFGGLGLRVAWAVLGLAPAVLFITGFIMWWARVVRPRWLSQRRTRVTRALEV